MENTKTMKTRVYVGPPSPTVCNVFDEISRDIDPTTIDLSFEEFKILADKARKSVKQAQKKKACAIPRNLGDDHSEFHGNSWYLLVFYG